MHGIQKKLCMPAEAAAVTEKYARKGGNPPGSSLTSGGFPPFLAVYLSDFYRFSGTFGSPANPASRSLSVGM